MVRSARAGSHAGRHLGAHCGGDAGPLERPEVRTTLTSIGGLITPMAPDAFKRFIADENERWPGVIAASGMIPLGTGPVPSIGTPQ